jgi:Lar family restriction alleviation protein
VLLECPHCASSDNEVVAVEFEQAAALAVHCKECGANGPASHSHDAKHAIFAWNQRMRR